MSIDNLRWGVLSTANIGRAAVIPALQRANNGTLVAIASRDAARAQEFAANNNIPRAYGIYEELFAADDVDAVYIPLPNALHREWTIKAAQAGKHILCEKPLALNAAECAEMEAAAQQHGVVLMEAFMYRFHPQTVRVLELIRQGTLGEVRLIKSAFTFRVSNPANIRLSADLGGGSLMDVGCYCVNVSRTLFEAEPIEAQAFAEWSDSGVDAQMSGQLRFANGRYAQFDSALTMARREGYEVVGTEGALKVPLAFLPGTSDTQIQRYDGRGTLVETETIPGVDEYQLMVEHFADCVRGAATLRYPPTEAAANMQTIEALYRSARNGGQPERVAQ